MEGLTAETCSFDGSRQTNYVQLLSLVDGDSLTQPAFGNLTATYVTAVPTAPVAARIPNGTVSGNDASVVAPGALPVCVGMAATAVPQSQFLLAYDLGNGQYAITGSILTAQPLPVEPAHDSPSTAFAFPDTSSCETSSNAIPDQQPGPSFDTEAQLEAPVRSRKTVVPIMPASRRSPFPSIQEWHKRKHGPSGGRGSIRRNGVSASDETGSKRGGWPKGKKRKMTHPRLKEPVPPATAYVIYSRERRTVLRGTHPECTIAELTRIIGNEWTALPKDEKQEYFDMAARDMTRYKKELSEYQCSPEYQEFMREQREQRTQDDGLAASRSDDTIGPSAAPGEEESSGLYCSDCDTYFVSAHNKSEHMRSQKHRRSTVGEFEKYLTKSAAKNKDFAYATTYLPEPVDTDEFIVQYMIKNNERSAELASLEATTSGLRSKNEQMRAEISELTARLDPLKREITQNKIRNIVYEQQLANLRSTASLFETEFGLFSI